MVERTRGIDIACHGILILGGLLVCLPIYFAFVVGSHTVRDVLSVPPPWLPGDRFFENMATAWTKGNLGRLFVNSFIVAVGIAAGRTTAPVEITRLVRRGLRIIGSYGARTRADMPEILRLAAKGTFRLETQVTRRYSLAETEDAYQALSRGEIAGRAVVVP